MALGYCGHVRPSSNRNQSKEDLQHITQDEEREKEQKCSLSITELTSTDQHEAGFWVRSVKQTKESKKVRALPGVMDDKSLGKCTSLFSPNRTNERAAVYM